MRPTYIVFHDLSSTKRKENIIAFIYLFFISIQINQQTKISLQWLFKKCDTQNYYRIRNSELAK